jgi:hypothetical protein
MNRMSCWVLLVFVSFTFFACTGAGMTGTYKLVEGGESYADSIVLKSNNSVDLETTIGSFSGSYRIDGKDLIITIQGQNIKFSIVDKNTLKCDVYGYEGTYKK